jgi:hypothetical protein
MIVTEFGIATDINKVQFLNADPKILVILGPIVTFVNLVKL